MRLRRSPYAWLKFGLFLAHEFRWPAAVFASLVLLGGAGLLAFYHGHSLGYAEACYAVFCLIFFETGIVPFPAEWYLQPFFFLVPIVGLGAVADSVVRLAYFVFTAKQKLPEWHRMSAQAMRGHVIVCGVGKLGLRVVEELIALGESVVAVEQGGDSPFVEDLRDRGVTVIVGDARQKKTLESANAARARAIIVATDDDLANLDAALTARELQPEIRVVLRLFDDTLARKVGHAFQMPAIGTTSSAAASFVAAATGRSVFHTFEVGGHRLHLVDVQVKEGSRLIGRRVGDVQGECDVNVVMHLRQGEPSPRPDPAQVIEARDWLVFVAGGGGMGRLEALNKG